MVRAVPSAPLAGRVPSVPCERHRTTEREGVAGMGAGEAYDRIQALMGLETTDSTNPVWRHMVELWRELDGALCAGGALPAEWERYTSGPAARYVGAPQGQWATQVTKGSAPDPDGYDLGGRAYWCRASLDRVKGRRWLQRPNRPPSETRGTDRAWQSWARRESLPYHKNESKETIIGRARMAGLLPTAQGGRFPQETGES